MENVLSTYGEKLTKCIAGLQGCRRGEGWFYRGFMLQCKQMQYFELTKMKNICRTFLHISGWCKIHDPVRTDDFLQDDWSGEREDCRTSTMELRL